MFILIMSLYDGMMIGCLKCQKDIRITITFLKNVILMSFWHFKHPIIMWKKCR